MAQAAQIQDQYSEELAPGTTLLHGQYRIESYLNSGGFGITYLARDSLDRQVVIKECFPGAFCRRSAKSVHARTHALEPEFKSVVNLFLREARNLSRLNHPNIVGVHQVFEDNDTAYMALDLVDGRDLLDVIEERGPLTPGEVQALLRKLLDAVDFMHGQDILHRDISPDNILLTSAGEPVLIDFGSAREEATKKSRALSAMLVVKDGYSPQEFYIAKSRQMPCSDLYSLGATFHHLITGEAPPNSQLRLSAIATGNDDPYRPLAGRYDGYDPAFLEAIDVVMNVFPAERIQTARQWILRIDPDRRREVALEEVAADHSIEDRISQLILETSKTPISAEDRLPRALRPKPAPPPPPPPKKLEYIGFDDDEAESGQVAPVPLSPSCAAAPDSHAPARAARSGRRVPLRLALFALVFGVLALLPPTSPPRTAPDTAAATVPD